MCLMFTEGASKKLVCSARVSYIRAELMPSAVSMSCKMSHMVCIHVESIIGCSEDDGYLKEEILNSCL